MSHLVKPGEAWDSRGVPIYPGDLLKSFHFFGRGKKRYWLYHIVVDVEGSLRMISTHDEWLRRDDVRAKEKLPGCLLLREYTCKTRVIDGYGPQGCLSYEDRPRVKPATMFCEVCGRIMWFTEERHQNAEKCQCGGMWHSHSEIMQEPWCGVPVDA